MAPDMFTGWGIRTMSKEARGYNPVSFYNGSVWPADTPLIANGMKKHGYTQESNRLAWGLVEAALAHVDVRLPELFCGFTRAVDQPARLVPHGLLAGRRARPAPSTSSCSRCSASTRRRRRTSCTCTTRACPSGSAR